MTGGTARRLVAVGAVAAAVVACAPESDPPPAAQPTAGVPTVADERPTGGPAPRDSTVATTPQPQAPAGAAEAPTEPAHVSGPRQLAAVLTAAERAVRDPAVTGAALADAGHAQQRMYRLLSSRPGWRRRVVRSVPDDLRPAVRDNAMAAVELAALVTPQRRLPDWKVVRPIPASRLLGHYRRAAAAVGIEWPYLAAINLVETRMGRIRGRSSAGAQGPMQFMPATWAAYGQGDVNNDGDAIMAAGRYLAAHGAPHDMRRALWHYNHSDRYVNAVTAYADVMLADERAFRGYYHWQVYYVTHRGDVHLPEGYGS